MKKLLITALICLSTLSCKKAAEVNNIGFIIGDNDIKTLDSKAKTTEFDTKLFDHSVLLVVSLDNGKKRFCSGSIIAPKEGAKTYRVLSNHHCFAEKDEDGTISVDLVSNHCKNTKVVFGAYKGAIESKEVLNCKDKSFSSDRDMDLAVFELDKNPSEKYSPIEFASNNLSESVVDAIVIHYPKVDSSDPDILEKTFLDKDLKLRAPYAQYTFENCKTQGKFQKYKWKLEKSLGFSIRHTCDQIDGSSGSALISREGGQLLGVNWGGIELIEPGADTAVKINVATSISNVRIFLSGDYEGHKNEVFKTGENSFNLVKTGSNEEGSAIISGCGVAGSNSNVSFILLIMPLFVMGIRTRKRTK